MLDLAWALNLMTGVLTREGEGTEMHRDEGYVTLHVDIGDKPPQANVRDSDPPRGAGTRHGISPSKPLEGTNPGNSVVLSCWPAELGKNTFLLSKASSWW